MRGIATIEGPYRYSLSRCWSPLLPQNLLWVMLNPSTADAETDDPTIRRVIDFSARWGYGSMTVANLYALRSSSPSALREASDPVGPKWFDHFTSELYAAAHVVCAWGGRPRGEQREVVGELLRRARDLDGKEIWCLGVTKSGEPRHPLYLPKDTERVRYDP